MKHLRILSALLPLLLLLTLASATRPARAQTHLLRPHPNGRHFATPDGRLFFALGYNYEGPSDRAWRMWQHFDIDLIAADIARARAGGANTLRIFVQEPLPAEITAGDFSKLDAVINRAAQHGLYVLLTLYDYAERDLAKVAEVNRRIAAHYRGNPTLLAYDLRNEPQFLTLASAAYPPGTAVPLQQADLVSVYGERVPRQDIASYRRSSDGRVLPGSWSDDQVYAYANNLAFFREFLADAADWVLAAPGRVSIDFPRAPEAQRWQPFWAALNDTLAAWIDVQRRAIREADPEHMLTIGWSNTLFASLPANQQLDFLSLHRFPRPGAASVGQTLDLAAALRRLFPNRPLLFEELGYSTAEIDDQGAAILEMATALRAYSEGYAGFLKWMLTDLPPSGNQREERFGALRTDGSRKPSYDVLGAFHTYLAHTAALPGGVFSLWEDGNGPGYSFNTSDAHYRAGLEGHGVALRYRLNAPGQVLLRKRGAMYLLATQPGEVTLNLRRLMAAWTGAGAFVEQRSGSDWHAVPARLDTDKLQFAVQPATPYRISLPRYTEPAAPQPGCRYFPETGHNLCAGFLAYWERNGGLPIFGYPITEEFQEVSPTDGQVYTVQYFERNRFEYHPELAGTPYEILLGLLGNQLTEARWAAGEAPFQRVADPSDGSWFSETGHTLRGAFRAYWEQHGGLAIFGYPISEEFQEYNPADGKVYTVQYFERNRFEYHPENQGTPYEVQLGLLGNQTVDGSGWR